MGENKKSFLIVGLGRFGTSLCEKLVELGQSVIGVDQLAGPVSEMSDTIDVAAQLDVTDESALIKVGAKEVDIAIVTIGSSLENSVLCTSILVDLGVPLVVARANTALHAKILARVGAHRIVFPEWDMGHKVAENFVYPWYSQFSKIDGGDFYFGKIKPLSEMVGKTMAEMKFSQRYKVMVILLEHDGKQEAPSPTRPFLETDGLWVLGRRPDMDQLVTKSGF
jgi:trk system potassium uptake protein TrkA